MKHAIATLMLVGGMMAGAAQGDTLEDALATAYENNPDLRAARAELRATDENVAQALSNWRPRITAQGTIGRNRSSSSVFLGDGASETLDPLTYNISASQPIFRSFRTINATKQAKRQVFAGRAGLRSVEQDVLVNVVAAYSDVRRDEEVVKLRQNNVSVLNRQLEASRDRFEVGEITRTDVAQSEARLELAKSNLRQAQAQLTSSRATYEQVVGNMPGTLQEPPKLSGVPEDEDAALTVALAQNPQLEAARFTEEAARYAVSEARGRLGPEITIEARHSYAEESFAPGSTSENQEVLAVATWQLYQGGATSSQIRQAKHVASQRRMEILSAENQVVQITKTAWENFRAANSVIESSQAAVRAQEIALEGVRQEAEVGARTTLDVLDSEQEFLDARVQLVTAQRDAYVAGYNLLAAIGHVSAERLGLPVEIYDVEENYDRARNTWWGWGVGPHEDE